MRCGKFARRFASRSAVTVRNGALSERTSRGRAEAGAVNNPAAFDSKIEEKSLFCGFFRALLKHTRWQSH
jgi:hypothetical protein